MKNGKNISMNKEEMISIVKIMDKLIDDYNMIIYQENEKKF